MDTFEGKVAASGYAVGPAYILDNAPVADSRQITECSDELNRLKKAVNEITASLTSAKSVADDVSKQIIDAQIALLNDITYIDRISKYISENTVCAEYAVSTVGKDIADEMALADDPYISERSFDIIGITDRLAKTLMGISSKELPPYPVIIFAKELSPEFVSTMDKSKVLGFVSERGSKTSHVSILCSNYGVPYLYGINIDELSVNDFDEVALDSDRNALFIHPDEQSKSEISYKSFSIKETSLQNVCSQVRIYANINSPSDIDDVLSHNADGIGLYRTEFLYMKESLPDEETQYEAYKSIVQAMDGKEVIIRTMDIGADKQSSCLRLPAEPNPALGRRAIRICLDDVDLFRTQLRALLRAGVYGNLSVMFPMITSLKEVNDIKEQLNISAHELDEKKIPYKIPSLGIMIETPSAAIMSDELAKHVDFFSIGTNDLTQYTLALDRMSEVLDRFYDPYSESVMRLMETVIKNGHKNNIKVGICGELAGDPSIVSRLVDMGIDELSMSPSKMPIIRKALS